MKMRKLVAVLMALMMLCCIIPFSAVAADGNSAVLDLTDKANRTSFSTSQQVWEQNGITVTNDKGASTSNVADYANPGRFYKSSTVTIEYPGMTTIVIDSVTYDDKDYAAPWAAIDGANVTATVTDGDVTIVFAEAVDSFTWEQLSAQARAYSITVYTNGAAPEVPEEPETPDAPALEIVTEPDVDIAYKLGLENTVKGAVYYFSGTMYNDYYGDSKPDVTMAADMYLENGDGGYYLYFNDANGAKKYIKVVQSGKYYNFQIADDGSVFVWDAEQNALCTVVGEETCYLGNYGNYTNMSTLCLSKLADDNYIARLYAEPEAPVEPDVPADDVLTITEALALGAAQADSAYTEQKYYVTGVIASLESATYGNMYIEDESGDKILIYGTWSADGATRYDGLEVKPVAGDTVTIYGPVGNYKGTPQIKNGWIVEHIPGEKPEEPEEPAGPEVEVAATLEEGVAYKLGLEQTDRGENYYFLGEMSSYYGATDTDFTKGVDMYVEGAEGGYKLYFNDASGAKQYIALVQSGTYFNFTFGEEGSVFVLDTDKNALCTFVGEEVCYIGTYGSYVTMGVLRASMLNDTDYIARLYVEVEETPVDPENPGNNDEELEDNEQPGNTEQPDEETDSPETGDNTTVFATLAVMMMALAAVVAAMTAKKRA